MKPIFAFFGLGQTSRWHAGQALVELLVAMGISAILLPALTAGFIASREGKAQGRQRQDAVALLTEAKEAVRIVRDSGWSAVATNGVFHPAIAGSTWTLSPGVETVSGFARSIVVSDVYRNATGAIVTSGGSVDPSTKQVVITVSWASPIPSNVSSVMYLSRFTSRIWVQTTQADFNAGTKTNVIVTNTWGGEVTLAAGGRADWCKPASSIKATLDLPGQGVTTAISAIQGHAYTTTGGNASGDALDSILISDPPQPASPSATLNGNYNSNKGYAVYAGANNVFIGSDHPGLTVIILNAATLAQAGYFSASGGERPGKSIAISGGTGYVVASSKLYGFDVSVINGSASQTELWSLPLAGTGQKVVVVGEYAYVATDSTMSQLQIVNLSNRTITNFTAGNGAGGVDVYVDDTGTYAYLVTNFVDGKPDFFIVDVTNKTSPQLIGTYSTSGMNPKGIVAVPGNRAIVVGAGGQQYQVINIDDKTNPINCGGLTNPNGVTAINAIASVQESDGDVYSYILTDNASQEFQIIEGGPGGSAALSGTFESSTFDATMSAAFNRFDPNAIIPNQTNITYQVSGADPVTGSCLGSAFTFVGPDGTSSTFFATGSAIPFSNTGTYKNPARCFRYRAYLTSSSSAYAPIFTDITVSYSP